MKAGLLARLSAAAALAAGLSAASLTGASAQAVILTGQFQCVARCLVPQPAFAYLTQVGEQLNLVNEAGFASPGWLTAWGRFWADAWGEGAYYSPDGMTIQFDNGTVWQRVIYAPPMRRHYQYYGPLSSGG